LQRKVKVTRDANMAGIAAGHVKLNYLTIAWYVHACDRPRTSGTPLTATAPVPPNC
jgi:hypothetical protein